MFMATQVNSKAHKIWYGPAWDAILRMAPMRAVYTSLLFAVKIFLMGREKERMVQFEMLRQSYYLACSLVRSK